MGSDDVDDAAASPALSPPVLEVVVAVSDGLSSLDWGSVVVPEESGGREGNSSMRTLQRSSPPGKNPSRIISGGLRPPDTFSMSVTI